MKVFQESGVKCCDPTKKTDALKRMSQEETILRQKEKDAKQDRILNVLLKYFSFVYFFSLLRALSVANL